MRNEFFCNPRTRSFVVRCIIISNAIFVVFLTFVGSRFAYSQDAEELLQVFLVESDDFCDEFCVRYKGQRAIDSPTNDTPRLQTFSGVTARSKSKKLEYYAHEINYPIENSVHSRTETFLLRGTENRKSYMVTESAIGEITKIEPDADGARKGFVESMDPELYPHGLAIGDIYSLEHRTSNIDFMVRFGLTKLKYLKQSRNGRFVSGSWEPSHGTGRSVISFDDDQGGMPVRSEYFILGNDGKPQSPPKSVIRTKWESKVDDRWLPVSMDVSGRLGESKFEYQLTYEWCAKEVFAQVGTPEDLSKLHRTIGTSWYDRFQILFDKPQTQSEKN